jgi:hypothetical protein
MTSKHQDPKINSDVVNVFAPEDNRLTPLLGKLHEHIRSRENKPMLKKLVLITTLALPLISQAEPIEIGDIPACTSLTPAAVALTNIPVTLEVRVLLDGLSTSRAQDIMSRAADAYSPLGITLTSSYETVNFFGADANTIIDEAKMHYGGARPSGADIVYVLTNKDLGSLAGLADCIGGVKYDDRAFGVGEADDSAALNLGLYSLFTEKAAKTAAHEIGHLMGAHHHYANCVESALNFGDAPCTSMFNASGIGSMGFSLLNGIVVRGHAQAYAQ